MTDFTTRLNQAMELRNIKQIDFVKAAQDHGVKLGRSHISQYVSGKTRPRRDILNILNITMNSLKLNRSKTWKRQRTIMCRTPRSLMCHQVSHRNP